MRITKVVTKQGDKGMTSLASSQNIPKDNIRIHAYGDLDELNSLLGVIVSEIEDVSLIPQTKTYFETTLIKIQNQLFEVGSNLCMPIEYIRQIGYPELDQVHVQWLESELDKLNSSLPPLKDFILPGGHAVAAKVHLARTVTRRVERHCVSLANSVEIPTNVIPYLNRLSDFLFVLARYLNQVLGYPDVLKTKLVVK